MSKISEFQAANGLTADGILGKGSFAKMKELWGVTDEQLAHILGQVSHESNNFTAERENLNYGAKGLMTIFKKYFPTEALAKAYERQPEKIANKVYASRMGNGDEKSGDGWKYRGAGGIQTTGKDNFKAFSDYIKEDCVAHPELVGSKYYLDSAVFFFKKNGILPLCTVVNSEAITKVTKRVNGGVIGLEDRVTRTNNFYKQIKG